MQLVKPRILLAEDHTELLEEVARLLAGDFEVVGKAQDGVALLERAAGLKPDVVVTDYKMPQMNGIQAGRALLAQGLCKAVVLLTLYEDYHLVDEAREAGILGFVLKRNAADELVKAVRAALDGRTYVGNAPPSAGQRSGTAL
jgi:DNA-binding NarL/FixJ family response regulator